MFPSWFTAAAQYTMLSIGVVGVEVFVIVVDLCMCVCCMYVSHVCAGA